MINCNINWYPDNYHGDTFGLDDVSRKFGSSLIGPDETYLCSYKLTNEGSFGKILNGDWFKLPSSIDSPEDAKDYVELALMKFLQNIIVK